MPEDQNLEPSTHVDVIGAQGPSHKLRSREVETGDPQSKPVHMCKHIMHTHKHIMHATHSYTCKIKTPSMVEHTYDPSTQEAEVGGFQGES